MRPPPPTSNRRTPSGWEADLGAADDGGLDLLHDGVSYPCTLDGTALRCDFMDHVDDSISDTAFHRQTWMEATWTAASSLAGTYRYTESCEGSGCETVEAMFGTEFPCSGEAPIAGERTGA